MILVQEQFGQVIIPFAINLGRTAFDVINGLGLVFIPFIAAFIRAFLESRAQGADEGPASVLAIKMLEKSMVGMLFVLIFFTIPAKYGEADVEFNRFQCGMGVGETAMDAIYNIVPNLEHVGKDIAQTKAALSMGMGLTNNVTIGIAESLSGSLTCPKDIAAIEAEVQKSYIAISDESLVANLKHFNDQCFSPALTRVAEGVAQGTSKLAYPYAATRNTFFGTNLYAAYQGVANSPSQSTMSMRIKDTEFVGTVDSRYKPSNYDSNARGYSYVSGAMEASNKFSYNASHTTNNLIIDCQDAAQDYRSILQRYVETNHSDEIESIYKSSTVFPSPNDTDGSAYTKTRNDILDEYVHQAFLDAFSGKRFIVDTNPAIAKAEGTNFITSRLSRDGWLDWLNFIDPSKTVDIVKDTSVQVGFAVGNVFKAAERSNLYSTLPLFLTMLFAVLYVASPLLIWLSGFSMKLVFNLIFIQFYLAMGYYWLNVSYMMSNILWMLSESFYASWVMSSASMATHYMAYSMPFVVLIAWTAACTVAGLQLGPFLMGLFTVNAVAAAKAGSQIAKQTLSSGRTGGSKKQVGGD
ncbi:hypothetical protein ACPV5U_19120 [Vibrio mediterranei]